MSNRMRWPSIDDLPPHLREKARAQLSGSPPYIVDRIELTPAELAKASQGGRMIPIRAEPKQRLEYIGGNHKLSEHDEQVRLFDEIRKLADVGAHYALAADRTFAIPNGGIRPSKVDPKTGKRYSVEAKKLKAEGQRNGVADVFVALPIGNLHGLFIEMKSLTGDPSREQRHWLNQSTDLGYGAACCRGWQQALLVWRNYVDGDQLERTR